MYHNDLDTLKSHALHASVRFKARMLFNYMCLYYFHQSRHTSVLTDASLLIISLGLLYVDITCIYMGIRLGEIILCEIGFKFHGQHWHFIHAQYLAIPCFP